MSLVPGGSETATVRAITDYLRVRGYLVLRMNSRVVMLPAKGGASRPVRMGGVKGVSDILACQPETGRWVAVEVKSATGRPTVEQTAFLAEVVRRNGIAFLARSVRDVQDHGL